MKTNTKQTLFNIAKDQISSKQMYARLLPHRMPSVVVVEAIDPVGGPGNNVKQYDVVSNVVIVRKLNEKDYISHVRLLQQ